MFVIVAAVGVFLPGIPTAGPLILASLFLMKSSPALERRLIRNRFFAKYLHYLDGTTELSPRAKLTAIAMMWISITISCLVLKISLGQSRWLAWLAISVVIFAGIVGTVFIRRYGRNRGQKKSDS